VQGRKIADFALSERYQKDQLKVWATIVKDLNLKAE